jgi:hypothetical protein
MKPTYDELLEENIQLRALVRELMDRVASLESQLKLNSKNSSKPPSSDQKSNLLPKRKSAGRSYHPGASRQLLPESAVTSREIRSVEQCPRCQAQMAPTGEVYKWQQVELPEIKPLVHQIELHSCKCSKCHLIERPELKAHETLLLGPRFEAFVNLCLGQFRQGHRPVREFIAVLIPGLNLSQGLISKIKKRGAQALKTASQQLKGAILQGNVPIHTDATGWRHLGRNENAIVMRAGNLVNFELVSKQNGEVIAKLFEGRKIAQIVTDRGFATQKLDVKVHQYCLAHLLRNIQGLAEHPATTLEEVGQLGKVHETLQLLFHDKHRLDQNEIGVNTWRQYGYASWNHIEDIIEDMLNGALSAKVKRFCKRMMKDWSGFKAYLRSRDSPMTNNPAEESLRNLVIARKLCFGSRSDYGRSWRASMQSCVESLRRSGSSILDFLTEVLQSERLGQPYPDIIQRTY